MKYKTWVTCGDKSKGERVVISESEDICPSWLGEYMFICAMGILYKSKWM